LNVAQKLILILILELAVLKIFGMSSKKLKILKKGGSKKPRGL